jgi:hypothetical protein
MVRAIMRKDWSLLWPMVAIVAILQMCLAWFAYNTGLFGGDLSPRELRAPLTLAWFVAIGALVVAVVHQDPVPGVDQDWLIRPLRRTELLLAKLLFAVVTVCAPMLALDSAQVLAAGFSLSASLPALVYKEAYFLLCFVIPVMSLAAITATMAELMLLGAALIAVFATVLSMNAWLLGTQHCPTCDTGISWIQHVVQHVGILFGAGVILVAQYYWRATAASRAVAVVGALALVLVQLPWSVGFAIQRWLSPAPNAAMAIRVVYDARRPSTLHEEGMTEANKVQYVRAVLRNKLDDTVDYLERHGAGRTAPVTIRLPLRIEGLSPDELLLVDRSDVTLLGEAGVSRYRGFNPAALDPPAPVRPAAADQRDAASLVQAIELPAGVYRQLSGEILRVRLDYSMTLMRVAGQYIIPLRDGVLRTDKLGDCAARPDQDGSLIQLRCRKIGRTPFCLSVTMRGAADQQNPEVLQCDPDYRPYLPTSTDPLNRFGVDIPIRDPTGLIHYPLEAVQLATLHLLIKVYAVREHTVRSALTPRIRLMEVRTEGR